jgi:hypothetical protein
MSSREPLLPRLDWATASRAEAQQYLRDLLDATGYRRRRGATLPSVAELGEAIDSVAQVVNELGGYQTRAGLPAVQVLVRLAVADFNRIWPPMPPVPGERP